MGFETPKKPTPEEMAKIQKERALSDAKLIKGGAEYVADEHGLRLEVTKNQIVNAEKEIRGENEEEFRENVIRRGIASTEMTLNEIGQKLDFIREKVDYQSISDDEFDKFRDNCLEFHSALHDAVDKLFNENGKAGIKTTEEDYRTWSEIIK